jgi:hypothetical protein
VGNCPGLPDRGCVGLAYLLPALSVAGASIMKNPPPLAVRLLQALPFPA